MKISTYRIKKYYKSYQDKYSEKPQLGHRVGSQTTENPKKEKPLKRKKKDITFKEAKIIADFSIGGIQERTEWHL